MDTSIYDNAKSDILKALQAYEKIEKLDTILFLVDEKMHSLILETQKLLELEYGYDKLVLKKYSINTIIKHLNKEGSTHTYSISEKTYHRQISEPEKVFELLDTEFDIWEKRLHKNITQKIKESGLDVSKIKDKNRELNSEVQAARKKLEYIKENFDTLDVKISSFIHRPSFGVEIRFRLEHEGKQRNIRLKNSIPNVLYLKEKLKEPYPHNKLIKYLERAENAFGDVYFAPVEEK